MTFSGRPVNSEQIRTAVDAVLTPGHFFVAETGRVRIEHDPRAETAWEIFRGHLLDASRTRERRVFETWNVYLEPDPPADGASSPGGPEPAPVISVRRDASAGRIHVTRNLLIYGWEAVEETPGVISSRPAQKWTPELSGTIDLSVLDGAAGLQRELQGALLRAVVGTSRLGITSVESPLPAYGLGRFGYVPGASGSAEPLRAPAELLAEAFASERSSWERAKLLELALRATSPGDVPRLTRDFVECSRKAGFDEDRIAGLFRTLFNHVGLSPYTSFVDNLVAFLKGLADLEDRSAETDPVLRPGQAIDLFGLMLRQLVRHLTAFDLVTFHNRGANYPDALSLDALLRAYLSFVERYPEEFEDAARAPQGDSATARRRRRALRQAWLARRSYEGLPVPEAPTSPGENVRVLPAPFARLPDEQILDPGRRPKRLYANQPAESLLGTAGRRVLRQGVDDLPDPRELRELGTALYLDRPLGIFKAPGEVDRTPLLSYEAFSRSVARRRLKQLHRWGWIESDERYRELAARLDDLPVDGYPVSRLAGRQRPGVVALEDAYQAADDFVFLRTTRRSRDEFLNLYDWRPLRSVAPELVDWLFSRDPILLMRTVPSAKDGPAALDPSQPAVHADGPLLTAYDADLQPRLQLGLADPAEGPVVYRESRGIEVPSSGLRVLQAADRGPYHDRDSEPREVGSQPIVLPPRTSDRM